MTQDALSDHARAIERQEQNAGRSSTRRLRLLFLVPAIAFAGIVLALAWGLGRNSQEIPSALIGRPVPEFDLPPVQGRTLGLSSTDLRGEVSLVNVFASWCVPCRSEHPMFMRLAAERVVPIYGINYKDRPVDAARWLDSLGDPYARTGADLDGRVAIEWGVFGVPETFVVGAAGRIAYRHIGALTQSDVNRTILPLIDQLRREAGTNRP